jgi:hypothetical protein
MSIKNLRECEGWQYLISLFPVFSFFLVSCFAHIFFPFSSFSPFLNLITLFPTNLTTPPALV